MMTIKILNYNGGLDKPKDELFVAKSRRGGKGFHTMFVIVYCSEQ